ncbi:TetR/AcrR family transcriptional regulator [Nocardia goodfellowii]|uniref:AcrR family transcriptional regulator n=1 Tax=Nocardia goodfellowii TaxID=882446 RepID=A0ABS4QFH9_9NOCA|nr:TetR/AcrR family transcriptional regulator [Nocardia goodfellowii]MBP2190333.1 AcrR family transcriptional regulator [Nocardia goodfellowii]
MKAGRTETQITTQGKSGPKTGGRNVWLKPARTPRDEPTLNRTRIVEEALALLDSEGIERLTMRRLAERLGHGSTTLYWHVDTKDDVLDLCLDAIYGEIARPEDTGDWRREITAMLTGWRTVMLRHRWSATLVGRPMIGPNILAHMEFLQSALLRAGLTDSRLAAATWGLYNLVMGASVTRAGWLMPAEEQAQAHQHLTTHSDRYPTLAAHGYMLDEDWDGAFTRSLDYLLDGIQAQIERGES